MDAVRPSRAEAPVRAHGDDARDVAAAWASVPVAVLAVYFVTRFLAGGFRMKTD
jgi:hypothetical protein